MKSTPTLLAALAALLLAGCDRNLVTAENAARLKPGMPDSEVKKVLGTDGMSYGWAGPMRNGVKLESYGYETERLRVRVECRAGKITDVFTRDPKRKLPVPARNAMSVLDLNAGGPVAAAMNEAADRGVDALSEWMQRELVPGRPTKLSNGQETVIVDRAIFPQRENDLPDYHHPVLAPLTDDHLWFTMSFTALSISSDTRIPKVDAIVTVANPGAK